jgi:hypothetical protein
MKKLLLLLLLATNIVFAEFQVEVPIEKTGLYCSGNTLEDEWYLLTQIMYDIEPMVLGSDIYGHCPAKGGFVSTAILQTIIDMSLETFTLTLLNENLTYYVRVRSCACHRYYIPPEGDPNICYFNQADPAGGGPYPDWVPFTYEALYESVDYDLSRVNEKLNCSSWRTEIPYRAKKLPNSES